MSVPQTPSRYVFRIQKEQTLACQNQIIGPGQGVTGGYKDYGFWCTINKPWVASGLAD